MTKNATFSTRGFTQNMACHTAVTFKEPATSIWFGQRGAEGEEKSRVSTPNPGLRTFNSPCYSLPCKCPFLALLPNEGNKPDTSH